MVDALGLFSATVTEADEKFAQACAAAGTEPRFFRNPFQSGHPANRQQSDIARPHAVTFCHKGMPELMQDNTGEQGQDETDPRQGLGQRLARTQMG